MAKALALFPGTVTGTLTALNSMNVSNIVRLGTGTYTVGLTTGMSSTAWYPIAQAHDTVNIGCTAFMMDATSCIVRTFNTDNTAYDPPFVKFIAYGDQ